MDTAPPDDPPPVPSPRLASPRLWLIAGLLFAALFAAYWLLIRTAYVPVLTNVSPQDAADIVKVLDERKLPYRLADGGRTILVASDKADAARIELVGSELPMRGQVGFELFNQSDMGLTEFAQKINYQRALQGELARTILLLDGIESVRVHLGLPEHGVFRDEQAQPKASVTLILKPGTSLTEGTVSGIQRMIAGAIPEMRADDVSVLDGSGRIVSRERAAAAPLAGSDALLAGYRRQIAAAISRDHPGLRYDLNLSLRYLAPPPEGTAPPLAPRGDPDFAVNIRVTTPAALDDSLRLELMQTIETAVGFDRIRGDAILFLVGNMPAASPSPPAPITNDRVVAKAAKPANVAGGGRWPPAWALLPLALAGLLAAAWYRSRRGRALGDRPALADFAEQLRTRLAALAGEAA
jgi:flagellar M-ring protein FliF